jgi:hypothetical protein
MTTTTRRAYRLSRSRAAVVATGVLVALSSALVVGTAAAQERTGNPAKWRTFWNALMPVFTHPRCINCHGATDPNAGDNHGGGPNVDDADFSCISCHTANTVAVPGRCEVTGAGTLLTRPDGTTELRECVPGKGQGAVRVAVGPVWSRLGPSFTGKDARALCLQIKGAMGPQNLLEHVQNDPLIGFAFEGRRAIDGQSPFAPVDAEPPPIDRAAFAALLTRWITQAAMACNTDGTVVLTDNVTIDSAPSRFGSTSVRNSVDATINIKSEVATSELRYNDTSTSALEAPMPGCTAKESAEVQSTAEGRPDTKYEIDMGPGGVYRMRFVLGSIDAQTVFSSKEDLCRPTRRRREQLPTEPTTALRFGVEGQQAQRSPTDASVWILKGSTTVPNNAFAAAGLASGGERKVTWDIVIR